MKHEISEQEWIGYLAGALPEDAAGRIRSHIAVCAECERLAEEQRVWHDRLTREAARVRWALELPERQMALILARTLEQVRRIDDARPVHRVGGALESMLLMQSLMESVFGAGTARMAMDLAARRTVCGELDGPDWPLFVTNLSEAVAPMGGSAAARLVCCAGACLAAGGQ